MNILKVKETQLSYIVNDVISVPKDSVNNDYQKIQKWIQQGGIVEPEFTPEELLNNAKNVKLSQLDKNRNDFCLIPIEYQGNTYATTINAWTAISYLANGLSTLSTTADYPNYPAGDNITLTKADFKAIAALIQSREMSSRDLRKSKIDAINAILNDEEYFDENNNKITASQALEAINITFE